ncbi:hypothetical protein HX017_01285 [Myroides marinus]|uniref:hypothetical protein n=1 Tax=Myroides marinus TaxID=703342 RepID=UPI0025755EA8|nr:hypothetical protein [Myroides marinus]MDM1345756.1 hypothetical protein [Myroides marinus]MDM1349383.1 hypothetical protein [Myroides marinus]MDM1352939.1 hypothetical protein [Myroides marinus]MDM1356593.1 hypothetical protein [Myroides marinus]MDM1360953.1 hypothetical protein [Myroides marinus]
MNKLKLMLAASLISTSIAGIAQDKKQVTEDYMRSSLYTIIVDDHGINGNGNAKGAIIKETFYKTPLPEKFNDHNLDKALRSFKPSQYQVTDAEIAAVGGKEDGGKKKGGFGKAMGKLGKSVASDVTVGVVDTTNTDKVTAQFIKFMDQNNIADRLIAKWFNAGKYNAATQSPYNMELIKERGLYNASTFDKDIADKSTRGRAMLEDAGENLIGNTFVVGLRFNYVNKEEMAKALGAGSNSLLGQAASVAGRGYVIKTTAFLFKLEWNEEAAANFYTKYYNAKDANAFLKSGLFKVKLVGTETSWADVQSTTFSKVSEKELVERATVRAIDNVIAKLQRKFEPFRTKTPLATTEPEITAFIGMKEDVESGDKFEVLEKTEDPETKIVKYKRVATIKAEKNKIWDNRFEADIEQAENAANKSGEVQKIKATSFSGNAKNIYPGMLIRQID